MSDQDLTSAPDKRLSLDELIAGGQVMSIWDHLAELRSRLMKAFLAVIVCF